MAPPFTTTKALSMYNIYTVHMIHIWPQMYNSILCMILGWNRLHQRLVMLSSQGLAILVIIWYLKGHKCLDVSWRQNLFDARLAVHSRSCWSASAIRIQLTWQVYKTKLDQIRPSLYFIRLEYVRIDYKEMFRECQRCLELNRMSWC